MSGTSKTEPSLPAPDDRFTDASSVTGITSKPEPSLPARNDTAPLTSVAYQPVSLLAVIGFGMSVLYATFMAVMALAAVLRGASMFWPLAVFFIPPDFRRLFRGRLPRGARLGRNSRRR